MKISKVFPVAAVLVALTSSFAAYAVDAPTKFTNIGTIANTRHNLTQSTSSPNISGYMDMDRNNYGEVCVYCHTPHGATTSITAPLWNRSVKATTYTTYDQLGTSTLTQTVSQPGAASLTCLSCHDGQTAIDSIINMPGSGMHDPESATGQKDSFLNTWKNENGKPAANHSALSTTKNPSCLKCHKKGDPNSPIEEAPDFNIFAISTDLRNDHPVGVTFPAVNGTIPDWNTPSGKKGNTRYFDRNGNGKMDSVDVRLYETAGKLQVECASCHDPHGVPSAGPGSKFNPTFLRVNNTSSALCLTCHSK